VREVKNVLFIVVTSNRGLCGGFNANVVKRTLREIRENYPSAKAHHFCIGKKGGDAFRKSSFTAALTEVENPNGLFDSMSFAKTAPVAEKVMKAFANGEYDKVFIVYNQFKNAAVQITQCEQFLPVVPQTETKGASTDYLFEPSRSEIVLDLVPRSLKTQLYKALLDSFASEHGARMTAMHKATDNAKELLKNLRISYNKARQASITNEILEIVGGAEALAG
jgi:F-type H+-transporting ATPase subunit gamma